MVDIISSLVNGYVATVMYGNNVINLHGVVKRFRVWRGKIDGRNTKRSTHAPLLLRSVQRMCNKKKESSL